MDFSVDYFSINLHSKCKLTLYDGLNTYIIRTVIVVGQCYKLYFKSTIGQRCLVTSRFRVQLRLKVAPLVCLHWPIFTRHGNFQKFY